MLFAFAEDPGFSIPNLISNLGSASAVVVVVGYFLAHLKAESAKFQAALESVTAQHSATVKSVEERFQRIFDQQSTFITTVLVAVKDIEASIRLKTATLEHLERTVDNLHGFLEQNGHGRRREAYVSVPGTETPDPD